MGKRKTIFFENFLCSDFLPFFSAAVQALIPEEVYDACTSVVRVTSAHSFAVLIIISLKSTPMSLWLHVFACTFMCISFSLFLMWVCMVCVYAHVHVCVSVILYWYWVKVVVSALYTVSTGFTSKHPPLRTWVCYISSSRSSSTGLETGRARWKKKEEEKERERRLWMIARSGSSCVCKSRGTPTFFLSFFFFSFLWIRKHLWRPVHFKLSSKRNFCPWFRSHWNTIFVHIEYKLDTIQNSQIWW